MFTLVGNEAARELARSCIARLDVSSHAGVHPRLGVVDVVPFVPLEGSSMDDALAARDDFARWLAREMHVPVFLYGPDAGRDRQLPEIRKWAWTRLGPDFGPPRPHPTAGATCVGARRVLVAYNVWLAAPATVTAARRIAARVRYHGIRALGFDLPSGPQVSMNLVEPDRIGPREAYAIVVDECEREGVDVERAELVGLLPRAMLQRIPRDEWSRLDLDDSRTIEAR